MRSVIFVLLLFSPGWLTAQTVADTNVIDIAQVKQSLVITDKCLAFVDSSANFEPGAIPEQAWKPLGSYNISNYIPKEWLTKKIYLKFTLSNSSDTANKVYFIASTSIKTMQVYIWNNGSPLSQLKDESRMDGYQPVELKGRQKLTCIVAIRYTKRNYNFISPTIVADSYLEKYKIFKYFRNDAQPAAGYILSGILLMMIFFTSANYFQSGKDEFLYNCCYSICMFGLVFLNTLLERKSGFLSSMFNEYLDFMLLATGTVFYIAFTRKFLDTKSNYPLLNKIFTAEENGIIIILGCFTIVVFFTNNFELQKLIENGLKSIVLMIGIAYIGIAVNQKNKLMNYLAIGNAILIFFSLVSFYLVLFHPRSNNNIFTNSMIYYELGIVFELIFFLIGLAYKNRTELIEKIKEQESLKREAEKASYETRLAVLNAQQKERNRISADMHDDLGAGVTAIRLYSELAKKRIGQEVIPEIEKISSSANELLNNMNAIIWTMSSSNDSLDNMVAYIRLYAVEYFENTGVNCHIHIEEDIPNMAVSGEIRRNVYLVVKEALSNILKHSRATDVSVTLKKEDRGLSLYIHDNGIGIDFEKLRRFGNGLINMKKRMEETKIFFSIENKNGTLIKIHRTLEP